MMESSGCETKKLESNNSEAITKTLKKDTIMTSVTETQPPTTLHKFFCPCCNIGYMTSEDMINHIKESPIKVKTYSCQICLLEFFVKSDLIDHQRLDHQMAIHKKYKCDECDLDYTNMSQLIRHKKMHDEIAQKLAASGIFLPRSSRTNNTDMSMKADQPNEESTAVTSSPSKPVTLTSANIDNPSISVKGLKEPPVKNSGPKSVVAEDDLGGSDSPVDAAGEEDDSDDPDFSVPPIRKASSVTRVQRTKVGEKKEDAMEMEAKEESEHGLGLTEENKGGRKKRGRPRKRPLGSLGCKKKTTLARSKKRFSSSPENIERTKEEVPDVEIPANLLNEDGSIRCPDCDVMCSSLNGLNRHRKFHFKTMDRLKCVFCELHFENRQQMGSHMTNVHPLKKCRKAYMLRPVAQQHPCTEPGCHEVFSASVSLTKHKTKVHGLDRFKVNSCEDCGKRFPSRSALTVHRRMHTDERPFKCDLCPKAYRASSSLVLHRKSHSDKKPFVCEYCGVGFTCPNSLRRHTRCRHTGEKPYMCDGCGATFTDHSQLAHHSKSHGHGKLSAPGQYTCELCNKQFRTEFGIRSHKEKCVHGSPGCDGNWKPKPVICEVCGREFPSKLNLKNHMVTHTDERPHKCRFCEATFRHYKSKYSHEKVHKGQKDFICNMCGKAFYQRINLKTHMTSHNEVKHLACRLCGKKFNSEHNRKRHEKRCMNYLKCPICSAIFRVHHRLVRHMNLNHQSKAAQAGPQCDQSGLSCAVGRARTCDTGTRCVEEPAVVDDSSASRPKFVDSGHPYPTAAPPHFSVENDRLSDEEQYVVSNSQGEQSPVTSLSLNHPHQKTSPVDTHSHGLYQQSKPAVASSGYRAGDSGSMTGGLSPSLGTQLNHSYSCSTADPQSASSHVVSFPQHQSHLPTHTLSVKEVYRSQHTTYLY